MALPREVRLNSVSMLVNAPPQIAGTPDRDHKITCCGKQCWVLSVSWIMSTFRHFLTSPAPSVRGNGHCETEGTTVSNAGAKGRPPIDRGKAQSRNEIVAVPIKWRKEAQHP